MTGFHQYIKPYKQLPFQLIVYDKNSKTDLHYFPKHWHEHLEIAATICGKGRAWIEGNEYKIKDNNIFIINPRSLHQIEGFSPYDENIGFCLQIDLSYFCHLLPSIKKKYHYTCNEQMSMKMINEISFLNADIKVNKDTFDLLSRIIKILKILNEQTSIDDIPIKSEKYKKRLLKISQYIENNYTEQLDVKKIADYFQISPSYLHKLFKEYFQQSIHQYITEIRMMHAIDDLKYTDLNILDICLKNGFANNKTFTNEFKKRFDMTPTAFRNSKKRENDDT